MSAPEDFEALKYICGDYYQSVPSNAFDQSSVVAPAIITTVQSFHKKAPVLMPISVRSYF